MFVWAHGWVPHNMTDLHFLKDQSSCSNKNDIKGWGKWLIEKELPVGYFCVF
jgi:hypothetical protein